MEFFEDISCSQVCFVQLLKVFRFFTTSELINQSEKDFRYSVPNRNPDKVSVGRETFWFLCWTGRAREWSQRADKPWLRIQKPQEAVVFVNACGKNTVALFQYLKGYFFKINFYYSIDNLQCCVSFFCTAKWISYPYTYIHSFLDSIPI